MLWSFNFFFIWIYVSALISLIFYYLPIIRIWIGQTKFRKLRKFEYILGLEIFPITASLLFLISIIYCSWSSYPIIAWFNHIIFDTFQFKIFFFFFFFFTIIMIIYHNSIYFSSREVYDFIITCFHFFFWLVFLFNSNSLFTVIFIIEIISTLIFLLAITSVFATTYFYNNLNYNLHNYFNRTLPSSYIQSLIFFFWISLVSSLNLFFFLILFYINFTSFDWFLLEYIYFYLTTIMDTSSFIHFSLIWFNLLFCIFLKCGLVPFFFWKPIFFKGLPFHTITFYILFFYFGIFLFFIYFLLIYLGNIFYAYIFINLCLLLIGFIIMLFIICESYYFRTFLAISSILNSLFVFLALNSLNFSYFIFYF